jgi:hypothetical protein
MNSHSYARLIFDKGAKNVQWRKDSFQQMLLGNVVNCLQKTETSKNAMSFILSLMFSPQQNWRTRGQNRLCLEVGG